MATLYFAHDDFLNHDTGYQHPENSGRLQSIEKFLQAPAFAGLVRKHPPLASHAQIRLIHTEEHIRQVLQPISEGQLLYLDPDTVLSPGSANAALRAVGAACAAVDEVMVGNGDNAFCAVRPPGHHAEFNRAMGFCLFNNVAIAAAHALEKYQLKRVAIVDFDAHHGNGIQVAFAGQKTVLYISSHEMPHYPGTGQADEIGLGNIINIPLTAGTLGSELKNKFNRFVLPALAEFQPELLLLSAGFDGHRADPLANILLTEADYYWLTKALLETAANCCQGRLVSVLEGGYDLEALGASVAAHVQALMEAAP